MLYGGGLPSPMRRSGQDGRVERQRQVRRIAAVALSLGCAVVVTGCAVGSSPALDASRNAPCALSTAALLNRSQLPPSMRSESPASTNLGVIGPYGDLSGKAEFPGSVGDTIESYRWTGVSSGPLPDVPGGGSIHVTDPTQVFLFAEEISDWGTLSNAERWMAGQRLSNQPNTIPDYGNGVERIPPVPVMGDDAFMYQIDDGAASGHTPQTGPFVGHIYTNIEVRFGVVILALSIDAGPGANPGALAVSTMQKMIANEEAVCPWFV